MVVGSNPNIKKLDRKMDHLKAGERIQKHKVTKWERHIALKSYQKIVQIVSAEQFKELPYSLQ